MWTVSGKDTFVFDGMAVIQMLQPPAFVAKPTYNDMASLFWKYILSASGGVQNIHVVFDNYMKKTASNSKHERNAEKICHEVHPHIFKAR